MRAAPPVQIQCGRSAGWALGVGLLRAAALSTVLGWLAWHAGLGAAPLGQRLAFGLLVALAALALALASARALMRAPLQWLVWDGANWRLDEAPGCPELVLDLGNGLLLRWHAQAGGLRWLPLALANCGASAHLVRTALVAHALTPGRSALGSWWRHG